MRNFIRPRSSSAARHVCSRAVAAFVISEVLERRLLLSITPAALTAGAIPNPSFETNSAWVATTSGGEFSQSYDTAWASQGSQSYEFTRGSGFASAGDFAEISQTGVDLTGTSGIEFDCQDRGIDGEPLQVLVDNQVMGQFTNDGWPVGQVVDKGNSANWGHTAITYNIQIPFTT
ncbi:MAG TPA: hypothetical protein VFE47_02630, partial [Tepidisphaeraceae bacterium]|nr:hypothetical protein [Tepidisphaeraceae bacterium]